MSQRVSGYQRQADDEYETPAWVAHALVPYLPAGCRHFWDPANGPASKIERALRQKGLKVTATGDDFLGRAILPRLDIDGILTNPPYGPNGRLACAFIAHALELVPIVAMLLRVDFDSGKTRLPLFGDCSSFSSKIVLLDRIVWFERPGAAGPSDNHAWYIWDGRHSGPPTIKYARRATSPPLLGWGTWWRPDKFTNLSGCTRSMSQRALDRGENKPSPWTGDGCCFGSDEAKKRRLILWLKRRLRLLSDLYLAGRLWASRTAKAMAS